MKTRLWFVVGLGAAAVAVLALGPSMARRPVRAQTATAARPTPIAPAPVAAPRAAEAPVKEPVQEPAKEVPAASATLAVQPAADQRAPVAGDGRRRV